MLYSPVVNLSCGNCKSIQSFSGNPPKCDVCGWVCQDVSTDTPYWQSLRYDRSQPAIQQYEFKRRDWLVIIALVGSVFTLAVCQASKMPDDFCEFIAVLWLLLLFFHSGFRRLLDRLISGITKIILKGFLFVLGVFAVLGAIYLVVQFIKWCWYH
jgi:hypothetical protein